MKEKDGWVKFTYPIASMYYGPYMVYLPTQM